MKRIFDRRIFSSKSDRDLVAQHNRQRLRNKVMLAPFALAVQRIILIFLFLAIWEFGSGRLIDPFYISSPSLIISDLMEGFGPGGTLWLDTGLTLLESGIGLLAGLVSGLVVAIIFLEWRWLDRLLEPILAIMNAVPRPALAPLAVLWFGLSLWSKVFIAWSLVFFVVFYNAYEGGRAVNPDIVKALKVMGARKLDVLYFVTLPAVASWVFAAFKLSVAYALIGAIVGEFVGAVGGLGYQLIQAQGLLNTDRVFTVLVVTGLLAWIALTLAGLLERRMLRWRD